ncbi:hypothetical protein [Clostridium perfringens]|uniref:hypothetical protein n=1 Tax=Clostridium perfringens TaxID=1502 RepID=UPI0024BCC191|nr:hypothetical protein [Clostridium perfringens]
MLERIKEILFKEALFKKEELLDEEDFENIKDVLVNDEKMNLTDNDIKSILINLKFRLVERVNQEYKQNELINNVLESLYCI